MSELNEQEKISKDEKWENYDGDCSEPGNPDAPGGDEDTTVLSSAAEVGEDEEDGEAEGGGFLETMKRKREEWRVQNRDRSSDLNECKITEDNYKTATEIRSELEIYFKGNKKILESKDIDDFIGEYGGDIIDQIKRINSGIINRVQPEVTVIDLYSIFANDENLMTSEYTTDGVHLNTYGYGIWVNNIRNHINKYSIKREIIIDPDTTNLNADSTLVEIDSTNLL